MTKDLVSHVSGWCQSRVKDLPKKGKKNILRKVDALSSVLKKAAQKRKKKRYREVILEMQSFSKMLRDITSTGETISGGDGERQ